MALNAYSVDAMLASIRRRVFASTDSESFPDADILALLNEIILGEVVPFIIGYRQGHFLTTTDLALTSGTATVTVPTAAIGSDVYSLHLLDRYGNPLSPLVEDDSEILTQYPVASGTPTRYCFRGNSVVLYPTPNDSSQVLRLQYHARPSQVVARAEVVAVTNITIPVAGTFRLTFSDTKPSGFTGSTGFDAVKATPAFDAFNLGAPTGQTSTTVDFSGTAPSRLAVGDWLCLSSQAPLITNIPAELYPFVMQIVAVEMLSQKGDANSLERAGSTLERLHKEAGVFLGQRVKAGHQKLMGGFVGSRAMARPYLFRGP